MWAGEWRRTIIYLSACFARNGNTQHTRHKSDSTAMLISALLSKHWSTDFCRKKRAMHEKEPDEERQRQKGGGFFPSSCVECKVVQQWKSGFFSALDTYFLKGTPCHGHFVGNKTCQLLNCVWHQAICAYRNVGFNNNDVTHSTKTLRCILLFVFAEVPFAFVRLRLRGCRRRRGHITTLLYWPIKSWRAF